MAPCQLCPPVAPNRAILRRPKTLQPVCKDCFFLVFETEIHHTIMGYGQAEQASEVTGRAKGKQRRIDQDDDDDDNDDSGSRAGPMRKHLFRRGEKVAIGASGGKGKARWRKIATAVRPEGALTLRAHADSTVLAYVMKLLNERYDYGLDLCLLSIDEGISGYRDASLDVRFLRTLPLSFVSRNSCLHSYARRRSRGTQSNTICRSRSCPTPSCTAAGPWTRSLPKSARRAIVRTNFVQGSLRVRARADQDTPGTGTYCGVFRRQAIDRGANILDVDHIVTGHNADDVAETVLMNGESARRGFGLHKRLCTDLRVRSPSR